jgi:hypothetical protein
MIVNIIKFTIMEKPSRIGKAQVLDIILILEKTIIAMRLGLPDVNSSIANHASITAGWACTERMYMIDIKLFFETDHKPWLVIRKYRASTIERFDVKGHHQHARWNISHLEISHNAKNIKD